MVVDLESLDLMTEMPRLDSRRYTNMRGNLAIKYWNQIMEKGANSAWANMRSLTYTLLNVIFKVPLNECTPSLRERLLGLIIPLISSLLSCKESDSNAGGLNILGALCGLQCSLEGELSPDAFRQNAHYLS